jgi:hypothetical protein
MRNRFHHAVLSSLLFALVNAGVTWAQSGSIRLIKTVELPGYSGDFDHFAADYERNRLLLAAEDRRTLEVFDLKTSAHLRASAGFGNPHSVLVRKGISTVYITDSEKENATIRDAAVYAKKQAVNLTPGLRHRQVRRGIEYPVHRHRRQRS